MSIVRMRNASKDWVDAYQSETTDEGRAQVVEAFQAQIDAYGDWEHFPSFVRLVKAVQNESALLRALKPSQFCSVIEMTIQGGEPGFSIPLIAAVREIPELFDEVTVDDSRRVLENLANGDQALHSVVENPDRVAEAAEDQLAYEDMTAES